MASLARIIIVMTVWMLWRVKWEEAGGDKICMSFTRIESRVRLASSMSVIYIFSKGSKVSKKKEGGKTGMRISCKPRKKMRKERENM